MKSCLIISGGEYCEIPADLRQTDLVLACDRGYQYAARMGIRPDWIIGDFDSAPKPDADGIPVLQYPSRKDDTDTMLAAKKALEEGCDQVTICCCFGGRLDHTLANLQTAVFLKASGARIRMLGTDTDASVLSSECISLPRREGWSLSLFALSDRCTDVCIRGTKYEAAHITLENGFPLGISNTWAAETAEIGVKNGYLLILQSRLRKGEHI